MSTNPNPKTRDRAARTQGVGGTTKGGKRVTTTEVRYPADLARHAALVDWCDMVGVPATNIPAAPGALTVRPINEATLEAVFTEFVRDADGKRLIDHSECVPGAHNCGGFLHRSKPTRLTVTDPPPGFHLPRWDAYAYVQENA